MRRNRAGEPISRDVLNRISNNPVFRQIQNEYAQAKATKEAALKEKYESNGEVQRWRHQMTPEQRTREAIERTAKDIHEHNQQMGRKTTFEDARKKAEGFAERTDRDKGR